MSRIEKLNGVLKEFQASSADVEACAVVSEDGLIMASALPQGVEEDRVAAMGAAMLSMGTRTGAELGRGDLQQLFVRGGDGFLVIQQAGGNAVLLALARKETKLGLLFLDMDRAAKNAADVLD